MSCTKHRRVRALVLLALDAVETHLLFAVVNIAAVDECCSIDTFGLLAHELDHVGLECVLRALRELAVDNADARFIVDFLYFLGWFPIWILDTIAIEQEHPLVDLEIFNVELGHEANKKDRFSSQGQVAFDFFIAALDILLAVKDEDKLV